MTEPIIDEVRPFPRLSAAPCKILCSMAAMFFNQSSSLKKEMCVSVLPCRKHDKVKIQYVLFTSLWQKWQKIHHGGLRWSKWLLCGAHWAGLSVKFQVNQTYGVRGVSVAYISWHLHIKLFRLLATSTHCTMLFQSTQQFVKYQEIKWKFGSLLLCDHFSTLPLQIKLHLFTLSLFWNYGKSSQNTCYKLNHYHSVVWYGQ